MLVKDLIYLLQTRAKPDDEVLLSVFVMDKDGDSIHHIISNMDDDFNTVWRDNEEGEKEGECFIDLGETFVNNFLVNLEKYDLEKATNGFLDKNGKRKITAEDRTSD